MHFLFAHRSSIVDRFEQIYLKKKPRVSSACVYFETFANTFERFRCWTANSYLRSHGESRFLMRWIPISASKWSPRRKTSKHTASTSQNLTLYPIDINTDTVSNTELLILVVGLQLDSMGKRREILVVHDWIETHRYARYCTATSGIR